LCPSDRPAADAGTAARADLAADLFRCLALLTVLLTRAVDGLGEDVSDSCCVLAEDV
jgi:hypothetical protein